MDENFALVAFPLPIEPLWYKVPPHLYGRIGIGTPVICPLRGKEKIGVVIALKEGRPAELVSIPDVKEVLGISEGPHLLSEKLLELLKWASSHYLCPFGSALKWALPPSSRKVNLKLTQEGERALREGRLPKLPPGLHGRSLGLKVWEKYLGGEGIKEALREGLLSPTFRKAARAFMALGEVAKGVIPRELSYWQKRALKEINSHKGGAFLLFGVTGSGKTEVYIRAAEEVLNRGEGVLVLVPEISLTPQLYSRFKRLGEGIAVLHSGMTESERWHQWHRVAEGEARLVLGARSALFAPVRNLGLIVVDEEHDPSYKQHEGGFRYHARDLALVRAKIEGATVILGSATPSVETFFNAKRGKLTLLTLPKRVNRNTMPEVQVVDMRGKRGIFSQELLQSLKECLSRGKQAILFVNRRGYAPFLLCKECGTSLKCKYCSVSLTYHADQGVLLCHYCGFSLKAPQVCPNCSGRRMTQMGFGTERVAEALEELFPTKRIARMDSDVVSSQRDYEKALMALERGEVDVLVGTQMVVKGHDFPRIELVGVVLADITLNLPDFRAAERTFQLLSQAAGRAGRGEGPGKVVIQTFVPEHYTVQAASSHNYLAFYRQEIRERHLLDYPPFCRMASIRVISTDRDKAYRASEELVKKIHSDNIKVLGPAPAPLERLFGKWRWQILLKAKGYGPLKEALSHLPRPRGVRIEVEVDPLSLL